MQLQFALINTVNPLYNNIRYNNKIHYNVNLVCTKIRGSCIFFVVVPMLVLGKTYILCVLLELPRRGDSRRF